MAPAQTSTVHTTTCPKCKAENRQNAAPTVEMIDRTTAFCNNCAADWRVSESAKG